MCRSLHWESGPRSSAPPRQPGLLQLWGKSFWQHLPRLHQQAGTVSHTRCLQVGWQAVQKKNIRYNYQQPRARDNPLDSQSQCFIRDRDNQVIMSRMFSVTMLPYQEREARWHQLSVWPPWRLGISRPRHWGLARWRDTQGPLCQALRNI